MGPQLRKHHNLAIDDKVLRIKWCFRRFLRWGIGGFAVGREDLERKARVIVGEAAEMVFLQKKILLYTFFPCSEGTLAAVSGAHDDAQRIFSLL